MSLIFHIWVVNFRHITFKRAGNRVFPCIFRFSLHPVLCVVRAVDESRDVLLLQRTEIETPSNHIEEHPECLPSTLL